MVIPHFSTGSHALLTRAPLTPKGPFDLHVLSMPPAFVLSQDQTLKLTMLPIPLLTEKPEAIGVPFTDFPVKPLKNLTKVNMNDIPSPHHTGPNTPPTHPFQLYQQCQRAKPPRDEPRRADFIAFRDDGPGSEAAALREPLS